MGAAAISGLKRGPVQTRSRLSKLVYFKQLYFTAVGPGDRNFPSKNPQPDRKPSRVNFDADPLFLPPSLPLLNPVSVFLPSMIFSSTFFALLPLHPRDILNITSANIFIIPVSHGWRKDGADFSLSFQSFASRKTLIFLLQSFPSLGSEKREREWKVSRWNFPPVGRTLFL